MMLTHRPFGSRLPFMMIVKGRDVQGCKHFQTRMTNFHSIFRDATGEALFPGTLNVQVETQIPIKEDFRIRGADIGKPDQDLLFERCEANGIRAYRIRPYNLQKWFAWPRLRCT